MLFYAYHKINEKKMRKKGICDRENSLKTNEHFVWNVPHHKYVSDRKYDHLSNYQSITCILILSTKAIRSAFNSNKITKYCVRIKMFIFFALFIDKLNTY